MKLKDFAKGFILISALFLMSSCSEEPKKQESKTPKYVKVEQLNLHSSKDELMFNGKIKEKSLNMLSFRVGGPLTKLNVQSGDYVSKGQILAEVDKRDYQTQLQTRKAQFEQVKGEYERYLELHGKNKIPDNAFEKAESGYLMAKAAYENAVHQLEDTELKAPFSGYVHERMTENFQTIGPGQPIVSIIDQSNLEVVISVPENQISNINENIESFITVRNANVNHLAIKLINISNKTGSDGLYKVRFLVDNSEHKSILPGMSAEVSIHSMGQKQQASIPSSALFSKNNSNYVWLYDSKSKTVKQQKVQIKGFLSEGQIEIIDGIDANDSVVTTGVSTLFDGQKVEPIAKVSETNIGGLL